MMLNLNISGEKNFPKAKNISLIINENDVQCRN